MHRLPLAILLCLLLIPIAATNPYGPAAASETTVAEATTAATPRGLGDTASDADHGPIAPPPATATVLINELSNGDARSNSDSFFELRNWSAEAIDLTGWNVYRCTELGLRNNIGREEAILDGIVLQPGAILTVSKVGMPGDAHFTQPFGRAGFGVYLEGPGRVLVDVVAVYPNEPWPTQSECSAGLNLADRLDFAQNESWQRVANTGDVTADFAVAPSTAGLPNATSAPAEADADVVVSEFSPAGPSSGDDEFIELQNIGDEAVDIGGWMLYRCTAEGRVTPQTLQYTAPIGTRLGPDERWILGGPGFTGAADGRYPVPLADVTSGVLLRTAEGTLVDRVGMSSYADTACQDGDAKLPSVLDAVAAESYQRTATGDFLVAPRTPGADNARTATSVAAEGLTYPSHPGIALSEVATDPGPDGRPSGSVQHNFVELGNFGDDAVDIGGWTLRRCDATGKRSRELQAAVPAGTTLEPGQGFVAALDGTPEAGMADLRYGVELDMLGTGVWLADSEGTRVDSIGIYARNSMDEQNVTGSPCTKGSALTTYQPDRTVGETFQRSGFSGDDASDFAVAVATPGRIELLPQVDATARVATATAPTPVPTSSAAEERVRTIATRAARVQEPADGSAVGTEAAPPAASIVPTTASVIEAWSGSSADGLLAVYADPGEIAIDPIAPLDASDATRAHPYQRFVLDAGDLAPGSTVLWQGGSVSRHELRLSVWGADGIWRELATAADSGAGVSLAGTLAEGDIANGRVTIMVQDVPRGQPADAGAPDGRLENPSDYDFAIAHVTDTQYLTESYPAVYAQLESWIADNAEERNIEFVTHTGDLVQNWVDPSQNQTRATAEFERASSIQSILDDAGIPNSVLPGNHDSKRGVDPSLFNRYFGPERYADAPWYGGSIAPGDNSSNFSTIEHDGAKFLMLSLPYAYGTREVDWAAGVVSAHPDYNVVISTHENVTPKTREVDAQRSTGSRWVSNAEQLWERVIAPNANVVMVLSGHFHGLGKIVTENAGGLPGHTVVELLADYQEFRTHTGERATGFFRMLQLDLPGGLISVDTRSIRLGESASYEYDYEQFVPDNGSAGTPSNDRPWRIVADGLQGRYTAADDDFTAAVSFQYPKLVHTSAIGVAAP